MNKPKVLCIMGKSGVGKSSVIKQLCIHYGYHYVKSKTTRNVREDDPHDRETHIFSLKRDFDNDVMMGRVLATYVHPTEHYINWTSDDLFDRNRINILAIDPIAFSELVKREGDLYDFYGIYLLLDEETRKNRLNGRGDDVKDEDWLGYGELYKNLTPLNKFIIVDNNVTIDVQRQFIHDCVLKDIGWLDV